MFRMAEKTPSVPPDGQRDLSADRAIPLEKETLAALLRGDFQTWSARIGTDGSLIAIAADGFEVAIRVRR